jgi:hypothetical protein
MLNFLFILHYSLCAAVSSFGNVQLHCQYAHLKYLFLMSVFRCWYSFVMSSIGRPNMSLSLPVSLVLKFPGFTTIFQMFFYYNFIHVPGLFLFLFLITLTASVVEWSEFLATDPEVLNSIPGTSRFSEKHWVWNGIHSASWGQLRSYLEEIVAAPVKKTEANDWGDPLRWPRNVLYPQKLALLRQPAAVVRSA